MRKVKIYKKFAEVYDQIMGDRFYKNYYKFIIKICQKMKFKPRKILELACGTGKLASIFLKNGYQIEGLDSSRKMLKIARKKGIKCYLKNMVDFDLNKKFDLILCIYDSLNYLQKSREIEDCLKCIRKHLHQGGLFIFDLNSDYKINKIISREFNKIHPFRYYRFKKQEVIWLNSWKSNYWIAELIIFEKIRKNIYQRFYEKHIEKAYKLKEIKKLLKKTNFKIFNTYSDFKFNKIKNNSLRWFFVCSLPKKSGKMLMNKTENRDSSAF